MRALRLAAKRVKRIGKRIVSIGSLGKDVVRVVGKVDFPVRAVQCFGDGRYVVAFVIGPLIGMIQRIAAHALFLDAAQPVGEVIQLLGLYLRDVVLAQRGAAHIVIQVFHAGIYLSIIAHRKDAIQVIILIGNAVSISIAQLREKEALSRYIVCITGKCMFSSLNALFQAKVSIGIGIGRRVRGDGFEQIFLIGVLQRSTIPSCTYRPAQTRQSTQRIIGIACTGLRRVSRLLDPVQLPLLYVGLDYLNILLWNIRGIHLVFYQPIKIFSRIHINPNITFFKSRNIIPVAQYRELTVKHILPSRYFFFHLLNAYPVIHSIPELTPFIGKTLQRTLSVYTRSQINIIGFSIPLRILNIHNDIYTILIDPMPSLFLLFISSLFQINSEILYHFLLAHNIRPRPNHSAFSFPGIE